MTKKITLKARNRKVEDKKASSIRNAGFVPGIIYGSGIENVQVVLDHLELEKAYKEAGESTLINLQVDDKPHRVLIKDIDIDNLKHRIVHVDFFQVNMRNPIEVEVPFVFVNESKAEREQNAVIVKNAESVSIRCLPGDLLDNIEIDLAKLENIGDAIRIEDLKLPEGIEILSPMDEVIVSATELAIEQEEEPVVVTEEASEGEEKGKEEDAKQA